MVEFVTAFVDEDLGVAMGIMYWYDKSEDHTHDR